MTERSAQSAVLAAAYAVLNVSTLTVLAPVYNFVPQNTPTPNVVIQPVTEERFDTMGRSGKSVLIGVHVYTASNGDKPALAILDAVWALLNKNISASIANHTLVPPVYLETGHNANEDVVAGVPEQHHVVMCRVDLMQAA